MLYSLLTSTIILAISTPIISLICFIKGYNTGAKTVNKEKIELPKVKTIKQRKEARKSEKEYEKTMETLKAIDEYGGNYGI